MLGGDDFVVVLIPFTLVFVIGLRIGGRLSTGRSVGLAMLTIYLVLAMSLLFFPLPTSSVYRASLEAAGSSPVINLIPFRTFTDTWAVSRDVFAYQIGGNLILLVPLGILIPLLWRRRDSLAGVVGAVLLTAVGVEFLQFGISFGLGVDYKAFDVDDLILNASGGLLGFATGRAGSRLLARSDALQDFVDWLRGTDDHGATSGQAVGVDYPRPPRLR